MCISRLTRGRAASTVAGGSVRPRAWRNQWGALVFVALGMVAGLAQPAAPADPVDEAAIRTLSDYWNLAMSEGNADRIQKLDMEFDVLYYDPSWSALWVRQQGEGSYLRVRENAPLPLVSGQRVRVTGQIVPRAGLDPDLIQVTVLATGVIGTAPEPREELGDLVALNQTWLGLEGYVDSQEDVGPLHTRFGLIVGGRRMVAQLLKPPTTVRDFSGSFVQMHGVLVVNSLDESTGGLTLWVPGLEYVVPLPAESGDPFDTPAVPIRQLASMDENARVRVSGVVFSHDAGRELVVRNQSGQLVVPIRQTSKLSVGDWVDVIGYPVPRVHPPTLRAAVYRRVPDMEREKRAEEFVANAEGWLAELQLARQVLHLTPDELTRRPQSWLVGVVTYVSTERDFLFLHDSSGGIEVAFESPIHPSIKPGQLLDVEGRAEPGGYAPRVRAHAFNNLGDASLPRARSVLWAQAASGVEAGQWIRLEGYLRAKESMAGGGTLLHLVTAEGEFEAALQDTGENLALGAVLKIAGVCANEAAIGAGLHPVRLLVASPRQIDVAVPAMKNPFQLPLTPVANLRSYRPNLIPHHLVRTRGIVTHHLPGRGLWIADGEESLHAVPAEESERLRPGQAIELVGVPGRVGGGFVLREARFRLVDAETVPPTARPLRKAVIEPAWQGRLVRQVGELVNFAHLPQASILFLRVDDNVIQTRLERSSPVPLPDPGGVVDPADLALELGSAVAVTGLYQMVSDESGRPTSYQLLVRSSGDIEVLRGPPWLNRERTERLAIGVLLVALGGACWLLVLQRRIARQRRVIAEQMAEENFQRRRYQDLVDQATEFIFTTDLDGRFTSFNTSGERMTGLSRSEALNRTIYDLLDERAARRTRIYIERRLNRGKAVTFEYRLLRPDGTVQEVETSAGFIHRNGQAIGCYGIMRDISQRKQMEAERHALEARSLQAQKLEALGTLASGIAHDFNNILASIHGAVDVSRLEESAVERQELFEQIGVSAGRARELVAQILAFSRNSRAERQPIDLREVVREVHGMLRSSLPAGVQVELALPDAVVAVRANATEMHRVLMNIATNAWHALQDGRGRVSLFLEETEVDAAGLQGGDEVAPGRFARMEIEDDGTGMTPEVLERIFDPFFTTKSDGRGTGLGLAAVHGIVRSHGGFVHVLSRPEEGTRFQVYLPICADAPAVAKRENPDDLPRGDGQCVLLVDDDRMVGVIIGKALRKLNYRVQIFTDSSAALDYFDEDPERVSAVLSDLSMPGLTGRDLAERLLAVRPGLPFIIQTGHIEEALVAELRRLGVRQVFGKPMPIGPLARVLHEALAGQGAG